MTRPVSRVPHLARVIFEKRCLSSSAQGKEAIRRINGCPKPGRNVVPSFRNYRSQSPKSLDRRPPPLSLSSSQQTLGTLPSNRRYPTPLSLPNDKTTALNSQELSERARRWYIYGLLPFSAILGGFIAYSYISYVRDKQNYEQRENRLVLHSDVSDRWKDARRDFDKEINGQESILFMRAKRRRLIREAYGDVLEVSCGTGRNMDLYDTRPYHPTEDSSYGRSARHMITSLTFNDQSPVMMEHAKNKWERTQGAKRRGDRFNGEVSWISGDARQSGIIPRPPGGYDTIIQSMGICSMTEPVKFLRLLSRLVRQPGEAVQNKSPTKFREQEAEDGHGGRIFLLEHGRGKYDWLNNFLDSFAPMHADRYGCWCNKDIGKVIEDSGLIVERVKRYQFGTVWEIVLRPTSQSLPAENPESSLINKKENAVPQQGQRNNMTGRMGEWICKIWR